MRRSPSVLALGYAVLYSGAALAVPAGERDDKPRVEPRKAPVGAPDPAPAPAAPAPGAGEPPPPAPAAPVDAADPAMPAEPDGPPPEALKEPAPELDEPEAAPPVEAAPGKPPQEDAGPPRVALARDTLGGHIAIGAAASLLVPFGSLQEGVSQGTLLDPGAGFRLDAAYGVSRTVMLGVYGELALLDGSDTWAGGRAQSIAVGPFVRYHLVQGVRFDPWIGFGAGFRRTSRGDDAYTGIDVARIQLGGDYYGFSQFGFGPLVELALGTFFDSSGAPMGGRAVNGHLTIGARFTFDGPGK